MAIDENNRVPDDISSQYEVMSAKAWLDAFHVKTLNKGIKDSELMEFFKAIMAAGFDSGFEHCKKQVEDKNE